MVTLMKEIGNLAKCMDMAFINGKMDRSMKESM